MSRSTSADERDRRADERERAADERDRRADEREIAAVIGAGQRSQHRLGVDRDPASPATELTLRQRLASLASEVAAVQEARAATLDRRATWDVRYALELQGRAAAARRFAQSEREIALRFGGP